MLPTAKIEDGSGVQNGVQNDIFGYGRIASDMGGLPNKSVVYAPEKGIETSDSDLRLQV
jgi:hypothetical protein